MTSIEKNALRAKAQKKYYAELKHRDLLKLPRYTDAPLPIITILKKKYRTWYEKELEKLKSEALRAQVRTIKN